MPERRRPKPTPSVSAEPKQDPTVPTTASAAAAAAAAAAAEASSRPYPPCVFESAEERQLYHRLKDIYRRYSASWDQDARDAWPYIVRRASLKSSTVRSVLNHTLARNLTDDNLMWAHVVVLRVIFQDMLFRSKKVIQMIHRKYPSADLYSFKYRDEYRRKTSGQSAHAASTATEPGGGSSCRVVKNEVSEDTEAFVAALRRHEVATAAAAATASEGSQANQRRPRASLADDFLALAREAEAICQSPSARLERAERAAQDAREEAESWRDRARMLARREREAPDAAAIRNRMILLDETVRKMGGKLVDQERSLAKALNALEAERTKRRRLDSRVAALEAAIRRL